MNDIDPKKKWNHDDEVGVAEADEWIGLDEKKPQEFVLVKLLMKNGYIAMGWRSGSEWTGYKVDSRKVVKWKRTNTLH